MKALTTLLFLLGILSVGRAQTIRRVNADATVTGNNVYHTLQSAHDAATAGDVLIVEPGNSTGDLTCTKTLTIYGRGYFLDKNSSYTALPNKAIGSIVGTITINASNVKVAGISADVITINGVSGVTISRCYLSNNVSGLTIKGLASAPASNITIFQNYMPTSYLTLSGNSSGFVSNVNIYNNQIGTQTGGSGIAIVENIYVSGILINQNLITGGFNTLYNTALTNNVFARDLVISDANFSSCTFNYNVLTSATTYSANSGSNNVLQANFWAQFATNTGSIDNDYRIINGSPLKTASNSGGEVGMFGGATPYVQYGIPSGPAVLKLLNSGLGNATTPINATISAASNN